MTHDERDEQREDVEAEPTAEAERPDVDAEPDFELHGQFFDAPSQ